MASVTTFGAFTTARLGMYASMKGLDVTGHNIANINTRGYTRQVLDQRALKLNGADRYYSTYDARVGSGVLTTGISQLRDPYLDIRFRTENASVGAADAKLGVLEDVSRILDEIAKNVAGEGVMEKQMADLRAQLQKLTNGVGDQENDTLVRTSAQALVALFNSYSTSLEQVNANTISGFKKDLDTVNGLLTDISRLNESIRNSEIHGDGALELRDERNLKLDQLSQYMKIDVTYEREDLGAGVSVQKLVVKLADDNQTKLIDGQYAGQLSITQQPKPNPLYDNTVVDPTDPKFGQYLKPDGTGTDTPGDAAQVDSDYFNLQVSALADRRGGIQAGSTTAQLNESLSGALQATRQMLTGAGEFNTAGNPNPTTVRGIPYYRKAMDALANQFATVMNDINRPYQVDNKGNYLDTAGNILTNLAGDPINKNNTLSADDWTIIKNADNRIGGILFSTNNGDPTDPTTGITAANISISKSWSTNVTKITNSAVKDATSTDSTNIQNMVQAFEKAFGYLPSAVEPGATSTAPLFTGSFQQMLGHINATLANDVNTTTATLNNYVTVADSIANSRDSMSGVDLNDEAANMMQYQKSYAAACRLMTTIDEALDKLINGTGVVGR